MRAEVFVQGIAADNHAAFIEEVLEPMGLVGQSEGELVVLTDLRGTAPGDVQFELQWHDFNARLRPQSGDSTTTGENR